MGRLKNRIMAALITRFPRLFDLEKYSEKVEAVKVEGVPWTPLTKPLEKSTVAIVTTAGVHLIGQKPFDMKDPDGDPTYRVLPSATPVSELMITHDYYDHKDADRDMNIVFPAQRLAGMADAGLIGAVAESNYGFMGHIVGAHVETLMKKTAPEVAALLKGEGVDVVLLTPG
ncbi:MAG: glycine/sarcosine/betaine reductase selenoprotein B family protein [Thermodesulfobacteriota bacterium]